MRPRTNRVTLSRFQCKPAGSFTPHPTGATSLMLRGERSEGQISPGVYAEQMPPGRGRLVRRGDRPRIVQIAQVRVPEVGS
jgi:hypothetical protein